MKKKHPHKRAITVQQRKEKNKSFGESETKSMQQYLGEDKQARYNELCHIGTNSLNSSQYEELSALIDEKLASFEAAHGKYEPVATIPGVCKRCGKPYTNPMPEITYPDGVCEIATTEYCAGCNAFLMNVLFRWSSAYRVKHPVDPRVERRK